MSGRQMAAIQQRQFPLGRVLLVLAICALALAAGVVWPLAGRASASGAAAVSAGAVHSCVLSAAGGVKCWGLNGDGQLGDGQVCGSFSCTTPVDVTGLASGVAAVTTGGSHTCALTTAGGLMCWGANYDGQLGDGATTGPELCGIPNYPCSTTPVAVSGLTIGVAEVSAGGGHTCAVTTAGGLKCWGVNDTGQLGNGTFAGPQLCGGLACSTLPVDVSGLGNGVTTVSAGGGHTCAVTTAGALKCWGRNVEGQLGDGQACGLFCATPVDVSGLGSGVVAVSVGVFHTCAVIVAGGVKCWGWNHYGQLGNGTNTGPQSCGFMYPCSTTPVGVSGLSSGVVAIAAGGYHTCALSTAGGLKCWGDNGFGQVGDGTTTDRATPVDVPVFISGVAAVGAGNSHTCALTTSGGLKCWGWNRFGQLGNGTSAGPELCGVPYGDPCSTTPVVVAGFGPKPALGGVAQYPDLSSGHSVGFLTALIADAMAFAIGLGGAAWRAAKRSMLR